MRTKILIALVLLSPLLLGLWGDSRTVGRRMCHFAVSTDPVPAGCLYFGFITNTGSSGAVEIELPPFRAGMDFIVSNTTGDSFSFDPNGTDRINAPATVAAGNKMTSTVQGDAIQLISPVDNQATEIFNSGGWNDAG